MPKLIASVVLAGMLLPALAGCSRFQKRPADDSSPSSSAFVASSRMPEDDRELAEEAPDRPEKLAAADADRSVWQAKRTR